MFQGQIRRGITSLKDGAAISKQRKDTVRGAYGQWVLYTLFHKYLLPICRETHPKHTHTHTQATCFRYAHAAHITHTTLTSSTPHTTLTIHTCRQPAQPDCSGSVWLHSTGKQTVARDLRGGQKSNQRSLPQSHLQLPVQHWQKWIRGSAGVLVVYW